MNKNIMNMLKFKTKTKSTRDSVNNFPTNFSKSITFLHPMGVCGWTFHRTDIYIYSIFAPSSTFLGSGSYLY